MDFYANNLHVSEVLFSNSKSKLRIPRYQRPYSWTEEQVSEFWNDLIRETESFFLGSFIFNYEEEKKGFIDVIDGQQRILTITIFNSVLRDVCSKFNEEKSKDIHNDDIALKERITGEETYRVIVGDSTKEYFEKYIQSQTNDIYKSIPSNPEEKRINKVYYYFLDKVETELSKYSDNADKLKWIAYIRTKLSELTVIRIKIWSEEDAYEIFETTNARGVDLSVSDLLKNVIFKHIPQKNNRDTAKETWKSITDNIENSKTELKKFIRYYWLSKHSFVTEKSLFKSIKSQVDDPEWEKFLNDLLLDSENWLKIHAGSDSDFSDLKNGSKIYKSIRALRNMKVYQCNVFLLSILRNFDELRCSPVNMIEFIEKFTFQYSAISKQPANKVERLYSKYATRIEKIISKTPEKKISAEVQQTFEALISELEELLPHRELFLSKYIEVSYKQRNLTYYILTKINEYLQTTNEHLIDFSNVNIEHILPQAPNLWGLTKSQIRPYVNLLGNLTILDKRLNSAAKNAILSEKLIHIESSALEINKDFVENLNEENSWTELEIINRQQRLGELSYDRIWNLK